MKQVEVLLALFEAFEEKRTPLTLTQLSVLLRQPKSSMFNLVETLRTKGYLYEVRQRGGFYPSRKLYDLLGGITSGDPLIQHLQGHLEALSKKTGETAVLVVRDREEVTYVGVVESAQPVRYFASVGDRRPVYATSGGKAILSTYEPDAREREVRALRFADLRAHTIHSPEVLLRDIEAALARGWFLNASEYTAEVTGIGLPLVVDGRRMALSVAGPNYRLDGRHAEMADAVRAQILIIQDSLKEAGLT